MWGEEGKKLYDSLQIGLRYGYGNGYGNGYGHCYGYGGGAASGAAEKEKKEPFFWGEGPGEIFPKPIDSKNLFCYTEINLIRIILI